MTEFVALRHPDPNAMKFYRFQDCSYSDKGESSEFVWYLVRETLKGYWITDEWQIQQKWVAKDGKKRFAYPSRALAFASYLKRKEKQVKILTAQLANATRRLDYAKNNGMPEPTPAETSAENGSNDFGF